ncbi:MAG: ABC transporter ATP-binding protein, partial [Xanthobacteraceae bacterium]
PEASALPLPEVEGRSAGRTFTKRAGPDRGREYVALENVSFSISPGEFLCLLGPSGCGKSTLLRMVAGFLPPSAGEVLVRGEPVKGPGMDRAVVFQGDAALFNWLTTEENVEFGLRMRGIPLAQRRRIVADNIRLVGLEGFEHHHPNALSGGMRQRVQIARVLANDPAILLMDEPFGALDAQTRGIMQQELSRIWSSRRKTVLFITHDIDESLLLGDRIAVMTAGPGATIKKVLPVPLVRPREFGENFLGLRREIKAAIEEEVMKSMRQVSDANSSGG